MSKHPFEKQGSDQLGTVLPPTQGAGELKAYDGHVAQVAKSNTATSPPASTPAELEYYEKYPEPLSDKPVPTPTPAEYFPAAGGKTWQPPTNFDGRISP
jgi:hypothetical protein